MLSYQHSYHAGNLADVHKHALLAWMLAYLTRKDKPLSYIETHAGRGLYDLADHAARKTGEAAAGIGLLQNRFSADHPYAKVLARVQATEGPAAYAGSPLIAANLLRETDTLHLAELHPAEYAALKLAMSPYAAKIHHCDGLELAHALTPPTPRRGLMLMDPSYEVKADYDKLPRDIAKIARAWNVGILVLWYPVLTSNAHHEMIDRLSADHPGALCHEVRFAPARPSHGMIGSGLFVVRPPFGLSDAAREVSALFEAHAPDQTS